MDQEIKCKVKEKRLEKPTTNMQGHPVHSPNIIIPRTFRWTLTNENHADIHWWMKNIKTNFVDKEIIIEMFDDAKGVVFNWLQALVNKDKDANAITLAHLDGCGDEISSINFLGLKIKNHITEYDYGSSEILTHKVTISYNRIDRTNRPDVN